MTISSNGPVMFSDLRSEFTPLQYGQLVKLSDFYSDANSKYTSNIPGIPANSNLNFINISAFKGKTNTNPIIPTNVFTNYVSTTCKNSMIAIYGFCIYSKDYNGPIVTVRNEGTSAVADFYSSNYTPTLANSNGQLLGSWLASANGRIVTWYDQSGRGQHLNQATNASQPIVKYDITINQYYMSLSNNTNIIGSNVFPTTTISNMHMITKTKDVVPSTSYLWSLNGNNTNSPGRFSGHWPYSNMAWYFDPGDAGNGRASTVGKIPVVNSVLTVASAFMSSASNYNAFCINSNTGTLFKSTSTSNALVSGGIRFNPMSDVVNTNVYGMTIFNTRMSLADEAYIMSNI